MHEAERIDWQSVVNESADFYRDLRRRLDALPFISFIPFLRVLWAVIKFEVFLFLDLFLIIPLNLIIFIRNIFPGRWNYKVFSWPYIKYVALWFWRGELPQGPSIVIRPIVGFFVTLHVRNRLKLLRKCIYLDPALSEDNRHYYYDMIDRQQTQWSSPKFVQIIFPIILAFLPQILFPAGGRFMDITLEIPKPVVQFLYIFLSYAAGLVVTAFLVKRGLMLGASGLEASFPGAIPGSKGYAEEKKILSGCKLTSKEVPFDVIMWIAVISTSAVFNFYMVKDMFPEFVNFYYGNLAFGLILWSVVLSIILYRRVSLRRG